MDENAQNRINRIEEFLLDPDKVVFESIEELQNSLNSLLSIFSNVTPEELTTLQGYTPQIGVDYFTEEDLDQIEQFILERLPVEGLDYPSVQEVQEYINTELAKIPRIKGDRGEKGAKGQDGKDGKNGSPDTPLEIIEKINSIGGIKTKSVKGLQSKIKLLNETVEDVEEIKMIVKDLRIVIPSLEQQAGGDVNTVIGEDSIVVSGTAVDRIVALVNDQETPGNSKYYGTDASGAKGYHDLPGGSGAVDSVNGQTGTVVLDTDDISEGSTNKYNVQADWNASSGLAEILNKPTLGALALKDTVGVADINATGTPSSTTYLRGDGTWATPAGGGGGTMDNFTIDADSGTPQTIDDGNTITFEGGTGIDTVVGATDKITIALDSATQASLGKADTALQSISVGLSVPTGLQVSGSPVTSSGTLAITYASGYQGYTTTEASKLSGIETGADVTDATNVAAAGAVMDSGNQTVAGIKTFSSFPITPSSAPTTDYQTANKKYVDDGLATKAAEKVVATTASTASLTPNYSTAQIFQLSALDETALSLGLPTGLPDGFSFPLSIIVADTTTFTPDGDYIFPDDNDAPATLETGKRYNFIIDRQGSDYFISWLSFTL